MSNLKGMECDFVIIGGGAVGCGVAYSLAKAGQAEQASTLIVELQKMNLSPELQSQVSLLYEQLASQ